MGVFKRTRTNKDGKKVDFWYMRYVLNGKETWKSAGKVGEITKTVAQKILEDIKRSIRMGTYQYDVESVILASLEKDYINYVKNIKQLRTWKKRVEQINTLKEFFNEKQLIKIFIYIFNRNRNINFSFRTVYSFNFNFHYS